MAKCPSCGADEAGSVKSWSMIGKPSKSGEMLKLTIGLYECCKCGKSFRCVEGKEKITMKGVLDKSNSLEEKLMEATKKRAELEEQVQALENEKACLCAEIEALKIIPVLEEKASSLESAVSRLRDEKEALLKKVKELVAERTPALKEKPLEAYITEPIPEVQSVGFKTPTTEPEKVAIAAETVSAVTEEVTVTEVSCEAAPAEAPVVEEKPAENLQTEPVVTEVIPVEGMGSEPTSVKEASVEITAPEPEPVFVDETAVVESEPAEPAMVESPPEVPVIEEKPAEAPQAEIFIDTVVAPETLIIEKPVDAPTSESILIEEKTAEMQHTVTALEEVTSVEATLPDVKLDEVKVTESPPGETSTIEAPPSEPKAEVSAVVEIPAEAPQIGVVPSETPPNPEKVVEWLMDIPTTVVASTELPTENVTSPTYPVIEEKIVETVVADVVQIVEPEHVEEKLAEIIQPSVVASVQEQPIDVHIAEVTPVLVAQSEIQSPEVKIEVPTQVENLKDKADLKDKPA